jgi:hypothetical protein
MRKSIWAGVAVLLVGATPGFARDYPWCARSFASNGNPQCDFDSLQQCQAFISGMGGDCLPNPLMASGPPAMPGPANDPRVGGSKRR